MSTPILDRLNARIAVEPELDHLDTLFVDLQDARDAIVLAAEQNTELKDRLSAPQPNPTNGGSASGTSGATASLTEAVALLKDAQGRLEVHALSDVGTYIDRAISILEG